MNIELLDYLSISHIGKEICFCAESYEYRFLCSLRLIRAGVGPVYEYKATLVDGDHCRIWEHKRSEVVQSYELQPNFHEALRGWMLNCCTELGDIGFIVKGSYDYDRKTYSIDTPPAPESLDLPKDFLGAEWSTPQTN